MRAQNAPGFLPSAAATGFRADVTGEADLRDEQSCTVLTQSPQYSQFPPARHLGEAGKRTARHGLGQMLSSIERHQTAFHGSKVIITLKYGCLYHITFYRPSCLQERYIYNYLFCLLCNIFLATQFYWCSGIRGQFDRQRNHRPL